MDITAAAFLIAVSLVVFGICYYYFTTRHRERMSILEKGLPPDFFKDTTNYLHFILLLGIVSIGISIGAGTGVLLRSMDINMSGIILPLMTFLFLGISLVASYFILKDLKKKS